MVCIHFKPMMGWGCLYVSIIGVLFKYLLSIGIYWHWVQFCFQFWTCQDIFSRVKTKYQNGSLSASRVCLKTLLASWGWLVPGPPGLQWLVQCWDHPCYYQPIVFGLWSVPRKSWDVPVNLCMDGFVGGALGVLVKWSKSQSLCHSPACPFSLCILSLIADTLFT